MDTDQAKLTLQHVKLLHKAKNITSVSCMMREPTCVGAFLQCRSKAWSIFTHSARVPLHAPRIWGHASPLHEQRLVEPLKAKRTAHANWHPRLPSPHLESLQLHHI
eukprot:599337-Amphidinium_carterae.1